MFRLILFAASILLFSCSKDDIPLDTTMPTCLQDIIDNDSSAVDIKSIRVQENNKELNYWINTDFAHFDGVEYIVNSSCDTVCLLCGECFLPECFDDYDEDWLVIWEN